MQKRLSLIIGVILALATVFMVKMYLDQQQVAIQQQAQKQLQAAAKTQILVAKTDIPKGVVIEPKMVVLESIPEQYIQPKAVTSLERIQGMVTAQGISKGEQVTLNQLFSNQQASGESLAMATPVGKRAISIMVDNIASLAGMMRPGDYVDVIGLIPVPMQTPDGKNASQIVTVPLFQNVLVLAVGQQLGMASSAGGGRYAKEGEKREGAPIITLALNPQEANLIAFVQEQGKIRFIMRSPADSQVQNIAPASWDALLQYIMPKGTVKIDEQQEETGPVRKVEIYRGLQKEIVPLSKSK
ncbi:MAG: Flp pilus assembly protein CpaB [Candidatus Omnitrophica bacterium]|nr:Flp pilus assembly protein CpaB [Candidatus Omnitrophota bacterium]MDD5654290.1 Flp pilus assembly protein CpaB [Candidatus Omnitrophota bacterium]